MREAKRWSRRTLVLTILYAGIVAIVGLWPFDFQARCNICPNGASVEPGLTGFAFAREGVVLDEGAGPEISALIAAAEGLTVAMVARSDEFFQQGPARIVSLSRDASSRNFTIGQQRDRLVFRLRTPATGPNGSAPSTAAPVVLWPGQRRFFVATYDGAAFRLYADGAAVGERQLAAGPLRVWQPDLPLLFGNETTGDRPWQGHLFDVAIYDRAFGAAEIAALRPDDLGRPTPDRVYHLASRCPADAVRPTPSGLSVGTCRIPARYRNAHVWELLGTGTRQISDYAFNALLWLPLGTLPTIVAGGAVGRRTRAALLLIPVFAVAVELGQASLFSRTSSALDLGAALLGAAAGVVMADWLRSRR